MENAFALIISKWNTVIETELCAHNLILTSKI